MSVRELAGALACAVAAIVLCVLAGAGLVVLVASLFAGVPLWTFR